MLWEVDIYPKQGQPNLAARRVAADAADLGLPPDLAVVAAAGYLIQGDIDREQVLRIAEELLADRVVERTVVGPVGKSTWAGLSETGSESRRDSTTCGSDPLCQPPDGCPRLIHVLPKPGVMDPVADSARAAIADFGIRAEAVRTLKKYWIGHLPDERLGLLCAKILANDAVEQVIVGPLGFDRLEVGSPYEFKLVTVPIRGMDAAALEQLSRKGQLFSSLAEMRTIQAHFAAAGRDPTDAELETIAQTWSEHCTHKTLAGRIRYRDPRASGRSRTCSRRRSSPPPRRSARTWAPATGASACSRTTPAWSASTTSITSSSRSRRTTTPRPSSPTAARTPAWAA